MRTCTACGGELVAYATYGRKRGRSFRLFRCEACGEEGGEAWGGDLPTETWGVVDRPNAVADGGEV